MNHHRAAAGFAATLLLASLLGAAPRALADPTVSLDDCAQQGGVYVVVTPEQGASTGGCIIEPESGTDALQGIGVTITRDAKGMICALGGYPSPCPAVFDGKYWQYYQAAADDAVAGNWSYATTGPDDTEPAPGWVEGWCYGAQCVPKLPADGAAPPSPTVVTFPGSTGEVAPPSGPAASHAWLIVGVVVAVAVVGAIAATTLYLSRRRSRPEHGKEAHLG